MPARIGNGPDTRGRRGARRLRAGRDRKADD